MCNISRGSNPSAGLVCTRDVGGGAAAVAMNMLVVRYAHSKTRPILSHAAAPPGASTDPFTCASIFPACGVG